MTELLFFFVFLAWLISLKLCGLLTEFAWFVFEVVGFG